MVQQTNQHDAGQQRHELEDGPIVLTAGDDPRADSRDMAVRLRNKHKNVVGLITKYLDKFKRLGVVPFKTEKPLEGSTGGRPESFALLNEDQCYYLLSLARNSKHVAELKLQLVMAFRASRLAADITKTEYLPTYHDLHRQVGILANGSSNARFVHMNINKIVNQAVGIDAGQRGRLDLPHRSMLVVAQSVARKAMAQGKDHREGYRMAKDALQQLGAAAIGMTHAN